MSKTLRLTLFAVCLLVVACRTGSVGDVRAAAAPNGDEAPTQQRYAVGHPRNPETWYVLAAWLSEEAKAATLAPDAARTLVLRGIDVNEQALAINPVYYNALNLKAVLLRQQAMHEKNASLQKKLRAEADGYGAQAEELRQRTGLRNVAVPSR